MWTFSGRVGWDGDGPSRLPSGPTVGWVSGGDYSWGRRVPKGVGCAGDVGRGLLLGLSAEPAWAGVPPPFRRSPGRGGRLPGLHVGSGVSLCPGVGRAASMPASRCGAGSVHAACAARAARAAGLCARMCAAGWTSGLWGRGAGTEDPVLACAGAAGAPVTQPPRPPPPCNCRPWGRAAGRWPTKGILCPGRMTPLCGWRVAGSHCGFLPSQLPARLPLGGRAPTWGPAAPARALLFWLGPPRGTPPSRQSEPCCPPAALTRPAGLSWAQPEPLLPLLHDLRCRRAAGPGGDLRVGGQGSVAPKKAALACSSTPAGSVHLGG